MALAGLIAAITVAVVPSSPSSHPQPLHAATTGSANQTTTAPSPSVTPTKRATTPPTPAGRLLQATISLLPRPGKTSHYVLQSTPGAVSAQFIYDDGRGAAQLAVDIKGVPQTPPVSQRCGPGDATGASNSSSETCTNLPGGAKLLSYRSVVSGAQDAIKDWQADLYRPDGVIIGLQEVNATKTVGAPASRPAPPLSINELATIVQDLRLTK